MTNWEDTYQQRRAQAVVERAEWPERYSTVRDALALGFLPHAYYFAEGPDNPEQRVQRPPTKFGYPAGGLAYPAHAGGPALGARFQIWSHQDRTPDELRDQPVWAAGENVACSLFGSLYRARWGLTLPEALSYCVACGEHIRQHFIVPEWTVDNDLVLPAGHWRELLMLHEAQAIHSAPQQLDLFAPGPIPGPQTHRDVAMAVIASVPGSAPDATRCAWRATAICHVIERLIDEANHRRVVAGVPPLTDAGLEDAA